MWSWSGHYDYVNWYNNYIYFTGHLEKPRISHRILLKQRNWILLNSIVVIFEDFALPAGILCGKLGLQRICGDCRASRGFDPTCRPPGFPRLDKGFADNWRRILWRSRWLESPQLHLTGVFSPVLCPSVGCVFSVFSVFSVFCEEFSVCRCGVVPICTLLGGWHIAKTACRCVLP